MIIDTWIQSIIEDLPNFAIAIIMLWRQQIVIQDLLATQKWLITEMMENSRADRATAQEVRGQVDRIVHGSKQGRGEPGTD